MSQSVQTIQATGKRWKLYRALGIVCYLVSLVSLFPPVSNVVIVVVALVLGVTLSIAAKMGAWWNHA